MERFLLIRPSHVHTFVGTESFIKNPCVRDITSTHLFKCASRSVAAELMVLSPTTGSSSTASSYLYRTFLESTESHSKDETFSSSKLFCVVIVPGTWRVQTQPRCI